MEKKRYIAPQIGCILIDGVLPLCGSGVKGGSGIGSGIGYGGKDIGGTKEPSAKEVAEFEEALDGLIW